MGSNDFEKPRYTRRDAELQDRTIGGKAPPHDLTKEAGALSAMICFPETVALAAQLALTVDDFYSEGHKRIFEAIREVAAAGITVDMRSVGTRLKDAGRLEQVGGMAYLVEILDATPVGPSGFTQHVADVKARSRLRAMLREIQLRQAEIYTCDPGADVGAFADQIATSMMTNVAAIATDTARGSHWLSYDEAAGVFWQSAIRGMKTPPVSWGLKSVDATMGGLHPGDLTIIAARPGAGKTALVMGVAQSVAAGILIEDKELPEDAPPLVVAVFSLEMPSTQLVGRIMCGDANIPINRVRMGKLQREDWGALQASASRKKGTRMVLYDRSGLTIEGLETEVKRLAAELTKKGQKLALVIVDYLQLMRGTGKEQNREQEISTITRRAKGLAKDESVPMVMLSQLSRDTDKRSDKRPALSDLRESGAIEQDADNVVFIYRPGYYGEEGQSTRGGQKNAFQSPQTTGITELIVAKQRNGPTGMVPLVFVPGQTAFRDLEQGEEDR